MAINHLAGYPSKDKQKPDPQPTVQSYLKSCNKIVFSEILSFKKCK